MWMAPKVKTYLISPFKMMMVDDVGEGGVKNDQKSDDVYVDGP